MSGNIPQHFIDELLTAVDIVELIDGFVPLKKTGNSYSCCCPFHQEKTPSFHVIPHKQFFYCFGCGVSGNSIKFIMQYSHLEFPEAIRYLADSCGMPLPEKTHVSQQLSQQSLYDFLENIKTLYRKELYKKPHDIIQYIKSRGLNQEMVEQFQLGYAPDNWNFLLQNLPKQVSLLEDSGMVIKKDNQQYYDRFRHRLMFPLHSRKGKLIGFAGRVIDSQHKPKYMNSPETVLFHKQKELYGLHQVLENNNHPTFIVVVEGYLDVISLFQFGVPNAVATMGTATSSYHLQILHKYTDDIVFCFDGDTAGKQAAWRALENCLPSYNQMSSIRFLFLPEEHDPDSFIRQQGKDVLLQAIEKAQPLHQYFVRQLYAQYGKQGAQKLIQEAQKILEPLEDGPGKELLIEELTRVTRLDPYRVRQWFYKNQAATKDTSAQQKAQNTPLRLSLALLVQQPELLQHIDKSLITDVHYPEPLQQVIKQLTQEPLLNTINLIERFRDSIYFDGLNKMVAFPHHIHPEKQQHTLNEIFQFLSKQFNNEQIEHLLQKLREQGLSAEEKIHLQELLKAKHQTAKS
jgi:DNA primase